MDNPHVSSTSSKRSPWLLAVIAIVALIIAEIVGFALSGAGLFVSRAQWSAVFLNDNEIFFGHITTTNANVIELTNVFYLQRTQPPQGTQSGSNTQGQLSINSLVTSQIQCPESDMTLDRANVLYTQDLQSSSFIVQRLNSLSSQKQSCFQPSTGTGATNSSAASPAATATP